MRQNQALDMGIVRDLPDYGRRHVQAPLHSSGSFGHGVVRDVADIWACCKQWGDKGAFFLTEP
jgi:hypothetical protein